MAPSVHGRSVAGHMTASLTLPAWPAPADAVSPSGELVIVLEVPGFRTDQLRVDLTDRTVTLRLPPDTRGEPGPRELVNASATPC